jgi:hypothetical protein
MDGLLDDIGDAWDRGVAAPGKETHMLVLLSFLASFGFIRASAHMIRAEVSWWPGNVQTKSGTHIHHLVWGILLLIVAGYVGVALDPGSPWREIAAVVFGIGLGLTLDEFALWLYLEDVYWTDKGRESIDAVIVAAGLLTLTLVGLGFWIDALDRLVGDLLVPLQATGFALAVICLLKGRKLAAAVGVFVPLVALAGAVPGARPDSLWARRRSGSRAGSPESRAPSRAR